MDTYNDLDTFVGAEYVIANALIELSKRGQKYITFRKLREIGIQIQKACNTEGINAVILTSGNNLMTAIYNFSDYFECVMIDCETIQEPAIFIKKSASVEDLEDRFVGYLPLHILQLLLREIPALVA